MTNLGDPVSQFPTHPLFHLLAFPTLHNTTSKIITITIRFTTLSDLVPRYYACIGIAAIRTHAYTSKWR